MFQAHYNHLTDAVKKRFHTRLARRGQFGLTKWKMAAFTYNRGSYRVRHQNAEPVAVFMSNLIDLLTNLPRATQFANQWLLR